MGRVAVRRLEQRWSRSRSARGGSGGDGPISGGGGRCLRARNGGKGDGLVAAGSSPLHRLDGEQNGAEGWAIAGVLADVGIADEPVAVDEEDGGTGNATAVVVGLLGIGHRKAIDEHQTRVGKEEKRVGGDAGLCLTRRGRGFG